MAKLISLFTRFLFLSHFFFNMRQHLSLFVTFYRNLNIKVTNRKNSYSRQSNRTTQHVSHLVFLRSARDIRKLENEGKTICGTTRAPITAVCAGPACSTWIHAALGCDAISPSGCYKSELCDPVKS